MSKKMSKRPPMNPRVIGRVLKLLFKSYPVLVPIAIVCILISAITAAAPALFMQKVFEAIENAQSWATAKDGIIRLVVMLGGMYVISWATIISPQSRHLTPSVLPALVQVASTPGTVSVCSW